jgi:diguanylate cyclase
MTLPRLSQEEMRTALTQLEQALFHHDLWFEGINRTLICGLAPDQRDAAADAHRNCRFGQWLYAAEASAGAFAKHPGFAAIEIAHQRMHQSVREMILASAAGQPISIDDYERFVTALKQMRLEVQTLKHELEDALYNLDPLTGAASRIGMLTKLRQQQEFVRRKVHFCCVAMMDLDLFKAVNDTFGHAVGDRVIGTMARHLLAHIRPYDMLFRYGGEEFLLCLPDADLKTGHDILDRVRQELAKLPFEAASQPPFHVSVSFGVTLLDPDVPVETSIERADKALYTAKIAGRNQVTIWAPSMG